MSNGINGGLVLIKLGDNLTDATDIVGQGDATATHGGSPIEVNNKASGGWRVNLDGSTSTKSLNIDLEMTASDEASYETLAEDAFNGTVKTYLMDFTAGTGTGYYYVGSFTPVLQSESAAKDTPVTATVQFQSSDKIKRVKVIDNVIQTEE